MQPSEEKKKELLDHKKRVILKLILKIQISFTFVILF